MAALPGWLINKKPAFAAVILLSPNIGGLDPIQSGIPFTSAYQYLAADKSEQTVEPNTPQLALFNEPESEPMPLVDNAEEEIVAPT